MRVTRDKMKKMRRMQKRCERERMYIDKYNDLDDRKIACTRRRNDATIYDCFQNAERRKSYGNEQQV